MNERTKQSLHWFYAFWYSVFSILFTSMNIFKYIIMPWHPTTMTNYMHTQKITDRMKIHGIFSSFSFGYLCTVVWWNVASVLGSILHKTLWIRCRLSTTKNEHVKCLWVYLLLLVYFTNKNYLVCIHIEFDCGHAIIIYTHWIVNTINGVHTHNWHVSWNEEVKVTAVEIFLTWHIAFSRRQSTIWMGKKGMTDTMIMYTLD